MFASVSETTTSFSEAEKSRFSTKTKVAPELLEIVVPFRKTGKYCVSGPIPFVLAGHFMKKVANPDAAASVAAGEMSATIAQFSYNMGYMGVENALKLANGESIPDNIDTGTVLVTKENAGDFM